MRTGVRVLRGVKVALFDVRVIYGLCGILVSIVAHEGFHLLMHLGHIESVALFPDGHTIFSVTSEASQGYNLNAEEAIAYGITVAILLVTTIDVFAIHDSRDRRNLQQTLFPNEPTALLEHTPHLT